jgi:hypothetical protein
MFFRKMFTPDVFSASHLPTVGFSFFRLRILMKLCKSDTLNLLFSYKQSLFTNNIIQKGLSKKHGQPFLFLNTLKLFFFNSHFVERAPYKYQGNCKKSYSYVWCDITESCTNGDFHCQKTK